MLIPQDTLDAGQGAAHVERAAAGRVTFKKLAFCYPLKLMPPRISANDAQLGKAVVCLYMLTYGGGLVAGDSVDLEIKVEAECHLVLLTQGNTKVFKDRPGGSYSAANKKATTSTGTEPLPKHASRTRQRMKAYIEPNASLFVLPAPVACFKDASYSQHQTFYLEDTSTSSLLLLDWFTSGRQSRGENWQFERYRSRNEVILNGKTIMNDVLLLEEESYGKRMADFTCYCNMFICGKPLQSISEHFKTLSQDTIQYQQVFFEKLIWSYSELEKDHSAVVRCAGVETETIKDWLAEQLKSLETLIGRDIYKATFV